MLKFKDENKEVVSSHLSDQSLDLEKPQMMLKLKDEITEVVSSHHLVQNFNSKRP